MRAIHPKLRQHLGSQLLVSALSLGCGGYGLVLAETVSAFIASGLFVVVGIWLAASAGPYYVELTRLLDTEKAAMLLTVRGSERSFDTDYIAELRHLGKSLDTPADIEVHLIYEHGLDQIPRGTTVDVFGVGTARGPVVIQLHERLFWPSGASAVRRNPQPPNKALQRIARWARGR